MASSTKTRGASKTVHIPIVEVRDFPGLVSYPKPQQIQRGAAQASRNFLSKRTWIETTGGYHLLDQVNSELTGAGKVLGLKTVHKWDTTEIIFRARKTGALEYYDTVLGWQEVGGVGSNILAAAAAAGENVYMDEYISPAGAQLWVSSPSSDLIKIMTANPGSYLSQYKSTKNFKGRIRIIQNSMFLWHYKASGTTSPAANQVLQRSYIDSQTYNSQTDTSITIATAGNSISGTLSKNSVASATVFATAFAYTDGVYTESFVDDFLGNLIGSLGGTGSINYSSGAFTLTPAQIPASPAVNCVYQYEDSTAGGIADFTHSGTRAAGQGVSWLQNTGGDILGVYPYNGSNYVLHQRNAWVVTPSSDDSSATNIIYRQNISVSSERGAVATADGIYYVDTTLATKPYVSILTYDPLSSLVLPIDLSSQVLDLSSMIFDQCTAYQWGDYIVFDNRTTDSPTNNRMLVYNTKLSDLRQGTRGGVRIFDMLDYPANDLAIYAGQLVAGDTITDNVYKLFDGFDADGAIPICSWTGKQDDLDQPGLKQHKKFWAEGYISPNQSVDVYQEIDFGAFVKIGTISGSGSYVDQGLSITVGSLQIGVYPIPGPSNQPVAYHYLIEFIVNTSKYKYWTLQFQPTAIGYFSVQMYAPYDIRLNVDKLPAKYRGSVGTHTYAAGGGQGGGLTPYNVIYTETPQGLVDGSNRVYTLTHALHQVFNFEINGEYIGTNNYSVSADGKTLTFGTALPASLAGLEFQIIYE